MPDFTYQQTLERIRENCCLVECRGRITQRKFEDAVDGQPTCLIAHSSFDPGVLKSSLLDRTLLVDPALPPSLTPSGLMPTSVLPYHGAVDVILTTGYEAAVPPLFRPSFDTSVLFCRLAGQHADMLDPLPLIERLQSEAATEHRNFVQAYIQAWIDSPLVDADRKAQSF